MYDNGYGAAYEEIEADNREAAMEFAYEAWREEAESNANYDVLEHNKDNVDMYL